MIPSFSFSWRKQWYSDYEKLLYSIVTVLVALAMLVSLGYYLFTSYRINAQADNLIQMRYYDMSSIARNEVLKDSLPLRQTIDDVVGYATTLSEKASSYASYRKELSLPYTYFLHYIYTPSLNIWKDPFSQQIDTDLIGDKYLQNNPYNDIELIQKWTNFFKDMGSVDQYNTITNITIGTLTPQSGNFFGIPITVQFETPDRRSFLLLVNKLSMTSYADNVSLISEFMYNLRDAIKQERSTFIEETRTSITLSWVNSDDAFIGYMLYQRVYHDADIAWILDATIINKAMAQTAWCTDQSAEECLYLFRDKYRSVPYLAYGIGRWWTDVVAWLQNFLQELPPLIAINSFSFDLKQKKAFGRNRDSGYKWTITIMVYGKDVSPDAMTEIADLLWKKCFRDAAPISIEAWQQRVEELINDLDTASINMKRSNQIQDMKKYFASIASSYETLSHYKKVIRLFEVYRTLSEGNACDIVSTPLVWWADADILSGSLATSWADEAILIP